MLRTGEEEAGATDAFGNEGIVGLPEALEQGPSGSAVLFGLFEVEAQLGVAEPRFMPRRIGLQCRSPLRLHFPPASLPHQETSDAVEHNRVFRVALKRLLEMNGGLV